MEFRAGAWKVKIINRNNVAWYQIHYLGFFHSECKTVADLKKTLGDDYLKLEEVKVCR